MNNAKRLLTAILIMAISLCSLVGCTDNTSRKTANIAIFTSDELIPQNPIVISKHFHEYIEDVVSPTCVAEGYTVHTCSCGDQYTDNYTGKTDHKWGAWNVTKRATTVEEGTETRTCGVCNKSESNAIPKIKPQTSTTPASVSSSSKKGSSVKSVTLRPTAEFSSYMVYPKAEDFGRNFENAIKLYDAFAANSSESVYLFFSVDTFTEDAYKIEKADFMEFKSIFEKKVLLNKASVEIKKFSTGAFPDIGSGLTRFEINPRDIYDLQNIAYTTLADAGVTTGMSARQAVSKINTWMINNISYKKSSSDPIDVITSKIAQCAGYAKLFDYLCSYIGIDAKYVVGCVDGKSSDECYGCHAWNEVYIDGAWHYIDVCWNDTSASNDYFLTTTLWSGRSVFSVK